MLRGELPMDVLLEWGNYKNNMNRPVHFLVRRFGNRMFGELPFTKRFNWKNAKAVKEAVDTPIMLVGGLRKPCDMERIVRLTYDLRRRYTCRAEITTYVSRTASLMNGNGLNAGAQIRLDPVFHGKGGEKWQSSARKHCRLGRRSWTGS